MEINHMTKHQVILLAILVAFVSSISVGIAVVSLMGQNQPVTQTINRIVERTVETIIQATPTVDRIIDTKQPEVIHEIETVIVKSDDAIISAVQKNTKNIVRLFEDNGRNKIFVSAGFFVSADGMFLTDVRDISKRRELTAITFDGVEHKVQILGSALESLALLKLTSNNPTTYPFVAFANSADLNLGQTVVSIAGKLQDSVNIGNIVSLDQIDGLKNGLINTSGISNQVSGNVLVNLSGDVVGINSGQKDVFLSALVIKTSLQKMVNDLLSQDVVNATSTSSQSSTTTTDTEIATSTNTTAEATTSDEIIPDDEFSVSTSTPQ
jgi:S1-C subfamily serine protease